MIQDFCAPATSIWRGGVWTRDAARLGGAPKWAEAAPRIDIIIPVLDEEKSIGRVIGDIPKELIRQIIVVDNGSRDSTAEVARTAGAVVISEPQRGYGAACLSGLGHISEDPPEIVVFLDGDYSDHPEELPRVIAPILEGGVDLVIGSRILGESEPGALLPQAIFGNWLACSLMSLLFGYQFSDLGPFRAIRWESLEACEMRDEDFGWTVEMQIRAAKLGLSACEVPVSYRKRIGVSKVSGTVMGSVRAGHKILDTIFRQYFAAP